MNYRLMSLLSHGGYMNEAGEADGGGAAADRGDDFTPTGEDALPPADEQDQGDAAAKTGEAEGAAADAAKSEGDDEPSRDSKGRFIPKERFDEAVRKERGEKEELARRLQEYEQREAQRATTVDFAEAQKLVKDLIKQHTSLLADGELDKASELMETILEIKGEMSERKAAATAASVKDQTKEEIRYDSIVAKLEVDYPQINPDAEEFDRTTVKKVQAYMTGLMQTESMSPSKALKEAVETILGAPKAAAAANEDKAAETALRRKEAAVSKALDAKNRQPASTKAVGLDHDKQGGALDASAVMKMSWDEFVKLPDAELAKMRGDFVS